VADRITLSEFKKIDLRVGRIIKAEKILKSKYLLRLKVDLGEKKLRNIISGIGQYYSPESIIDRFFVFISNIEPKKIMGEESDGMILCADIAGKPVCLEVPGGKEGAKII